MFEVAEPTEADAETEARSEQELYGSFVRYMDAARRVMDPTMPNEACRNAVVQICRRMRRIQFFQACLASTKNDPEARREFVRILHTGFSEDLTPEERKVWEQRLSSLD